MNDQIRQTTQATLREKGWTQDDLARASGLQQATVSRLLTGQRGKSKGLVAILEALDLQLIAVPKNDGRISRSREDVSCEKKGAR